MSVYRRREEDARLRDERRIGPEMAAEIAYCYVELGWSEHRIGAYLDREPVRILGVLRRRGVPLRPALGRRPACDVDRIVELGRLGVSRTIIAETTGATANQVYYHLTKHGVPSRPQVRHGAVA